MVDEDVWVMKHDVLFITPPASQLSEQHLHSGQSSFVGKRWIISARPRRKRAHHQYQRGRAPVSVGMARRHCYKGRGWSSHWKGVHKRLLKRHLAGWSSPWRTLDDGLFSSSPSQRPGDGGPEQAATSQADQPSTCYCGVDSPDQASRGLDQARRGTREEGGHLRSISAGLIVPHVCKVLQGAPVGKDVP